MADPFRLPPMHTVERDNYEAEKRRRKNLKCRCGNRRRFGEEKCIRCANPHLKTATVSPEASREAELYLSKSYDRKTKP